MHRTPKTWRMLVLGGVLGLAGAIASRLPAVLALDESVGLAALFAVVPPPRPPRDVAVVSVSRATYDTLGYPDELDEWPRSIHARLIERLASAGATTIAFDIAFTELREAPEDAALAAAIARAGNVLLLEPTRPPRPAARVALERAGISIEQREPPAPIFKAAALGSAPFVLPFVPVRLSQFWAFDRMGANVPNLPALALHAHALERGVDLRALLDEPTPGGAIAGGSLGAMATNQALEQLVQAIRDAFEREPDLAGRLRAAADARAAPSERPLLHALIDLYAGAPSGYLRYYGPAGTLPTIPYEVAVGATAGESPLDVEGRAVFVGLAEASQPEQLDDFYSVYSDAAGRNLSGVEVGATAFANLLRRELIAPLAIWPQLALLAAWGCLLGGFVMLRRLTLALVLPALAALAYGTVAVGLFARASLWLPLFVPILLQLPLALVLGATWRFALERARRLRVGQALSSYVPGAAIVGIEDTPISRDSGRALIRGACLVSDVHGYTELAERLGPEPLAALMNDYYELLFGIVQRHDGIITDTAGDSMIAVFEQAADSVSGQTAACRAALAMQRELVAFNGLHPDEELVTRIGIDAGEMLLTNVGSGTRFNYRAVGDPVNTAARIQALARDVGTEVLVSEAAANLDAFGWRTMGRFRLAGKAQSVGLYELRGLDREDGRAERAAFAQAITAFQARNWESAASSFERVLATVPGDGPARFYLRQCEEHARARPQSGWDGSVAWLRK